MTPGRWGLPTEVAGDHEASAAHGWCPATGGPAPPGARRMVKPVPDAPPALTAQDAETLERCMESGGIAVIPTDTVYGLACDPTSPEALARLREAKGRPSGKPSAIVFSRVELALAATPWLPDAIVEALALLLPGAVTLVVPNPEHRYAAACGDTPSALGIRVPAWPERAEVLATTAWPVMATSANRSGGVDPASIDAIDTEVAEACDVVLDAGTLPGTASTVVDLRTYADDGSWSVLRRGAVDERTLARRLDR